MTRECGPYSFYWCIGAPRENVFLPLDHLSWRWFFLSHFYFEKYIDYKKEWNYNSYNKFPDDSSNAGDDKESRRSRESTESCPKAGRAVMTDR
jgi:hypothetical protein